MENTSVKHRILEAAKPYLENLTVKDLVVGISLIAVQLSNEAVGYWINSPKVAAKSAASPSKAASADESFCTPTFLPAKSVLDVMPASLATTNT